MAARGVLWWTLLACGCAGFFRLTVLAQDKVSLGCFGSAGSCLNHNLTCPDTARVAIQEALYGHKTWVNCTTGVISCSDTCCSYLRNSDCFHTFIAGDIGDIYRNCSSHFCDFRTPRLTEPCTGFQAISSYSVVEYECVEESSIIPMCGAAKYTVGQSVSILYDPTQQYMDPTDVCYCTMYQPTRSQVVIEGIDIRLAGPNGGCGTLGIHNSTSAFPQRNCRSPSTWPSLSLAQTSDRYFYLTLTNRAEFVWIRFKATNSLTVACSLNAVHTTTPAPTTTTSTTTSTTTTTVTYPTAPPPTTRPPPTRSSSSTPQTSTTSTITSTTTSTTTKAPTATPTPTPTPTTTLVSPMTTTAVLPTTTTSSASSTSPGTTTDSNSRSTERQATSTGPADNVGTIIGAVVGGVAFLIVVIVVITWCRKKHKTAKQSDTSGRQSAIYDNIVTSGVPNSNHVYKTIKPPESKAVGPPQPVSQPQPVGPAQTVGPPQPVEASQKKEAAELNSKLTNNNNTKSNEHTYITIIPSEAVKENNIISIRL